MNINGLINESFLNSSVAFSARLLMIGALISSGIQLAIIIWVVEPIILSVREHVVVDLKACCLLFSIIRKYLIYDMDLTAIEGRPGIA